MSAAGPKITVIGAGSYFFGRPVIHQMATSEVFAGGTLALVDTDPKVLATMMQLARRIFAHTGCGVKVVGSTDRRDVMADSDFIVLTFSKRNAYYRGVDTEIALKHGIRMCSADTIGPGGIFRALREIPHALAMARDAEKLAPKAWVINFVNPTAVIGLALQRFAPQVRSFALCDILHEPHVTLRWGKAVGILPQDAKSVPVEVARKLDLVIGGVNHCNWILKFNYDGKNMLPALRQHIVAKAKEEVIKTYEAAKPRYDWHYALQLFDLYGTMSTGFGHVKEYVPFFQGYGVAPVKPEPIRTFDAVDRAKGMAEAWAKTQQYATGKISPRQFIKDIGNDHATDVIESMWGNLHKVFYINCLNRGSVTNLSGDAFLEMHCDVDMNGPKPHPVGAFPPGLLAIQQQALDTHELTAQAAVTGDRTLLRRAMLTDPICNNIADADACIADLLEAQKEVLPKYWYKKSKA